MLAVLEITVLAACVYAGSFLRFAGDPAQVSEYIGVLPTRAVVIAAVLSICMLALGLYQPNLRDGMIGVLLRTMIAFAIGSVALTLVFYLWPDVFLGRGALILSLLLAFPLVLLLRTGFAHYINQNALRNRVLVLGTGDRAALIANRLRRKSDQRGFMLLGYMPASPQERSSIASERILPHGESLLDSVKRLQVEEIVVAVDDQRNAVPMEQLLQCKLAGVHVTDVITFIEREAQRVDVSLLKPSWLIYSDGCGHYRGLRLWVMRTFDIFASLSLLLIMWPVMLLVAIAIKIEDGWKAPVIYSQERVGQNGRVFRVHKFRSMIPDAEADGARWAARNDMRVTRVGEVIRRYRIDELPQLFNVLVGDMAFVGPRPERPVFVEQLSRELPFYGERHRVKPGLTGWAQLNYPYGASVTDSLRKLEYDIYYVKNHSLLLDIMILLQTVEVVLFGRGR